MNRTLMERDRSMLSGADLEKKLSIEVVSTNKSPTSSLMDTIPIEVWMGKKPSLENLHDFGCEEYAHVHKEEKFKLDNKAVKCIFISYGVGLKWYKIFDPIVGNFLYNFFFVLREVKPSPIVVHPEEYERKLVVQLSTKTHKVEEKN
jgi:hypothetical protein